jgi:GDP-4-dehydro-6-deoxy-D-mannose reductase
LREAARQLRPVPRVLLVSSAEVYGKVPPQRMPISEDEPFVPVTPYAASKVAAEMVGLPAWTGRGLPVVRARPFNHTGPGQAGGFVVPDLAAQVARAARGAVDRVATGNLETSRDITDVPTNLGDPRRLQQLTGWQARIPLDRSLADVLASFEAPAG